MMKRVAMAITFAIGRWHSIQPSERVIPESSGNRFSLAWGEGRGGHEDNTWVTL